MSFLWRVACAFLLTSSTLAAPAPGIVERDLDSFITAEKAIALNGILANIGANGSLSQGASAGVVIASPSTVNPDYLFTWTRDSALTLKTLIDEFIAGNPALQSHIEDYIHAQAVLQTLTNPSGDFFTGTGLGEPKYIIDITRFNAPWGRPQRDGPALRAVALMSYINWLIDNNQSDQAKTVVWPIVQNDLNYVGQYWNQSGFDLWEETFGSSFFTIQNQHRAMVQGAQLAKQLGLTCSACESQAPELLCFLQSFWNGTSVVANINTATVRSGRDSNTLLGAIATFDIDGDCDDETFQPCSSKILASHKVLVDSFRDIYPINAGLGAGQAAAVGRYPEDIYFNGNPWYLCTLAAAEVLYDAVAQWQANHKLTVDDISLPFFQDIFPAATTQVYSGGNANSDFNQIMSAVTNYADGFVAIAEQYIPTNGSIGEQFLRDTGLPTSAYELTWSFASFVTMSERRSGHFPASWGSKKATPAPATCSGTSVQGTYVPALAAGAPNITEICTISTTFIVNASTFFGENIFLTGNTTDLGVWDPANSDGMNAANYSDARHEWFLTIDLPASTFIDYQYLRQEPDGSFFFETVNRTLAIPACGDPAIETNDAWTGPGGGD